MVDDVTFYWLVGAGSKSLKLFHCHKTKEKRTASVKTADDKRECYLVQTFGHKKSTSYEK